MIPRILTVVAALLWAGSTFAADVTLLNVSHDRTCEFDLDFNKAFAATSRFASKNAFGAYDDVGIAENSQPAPRLAGALGHITAVASGIIPSSDHVIALRDIAAARAESDETPQSYCRRTYHSLRHCI